MSIYSDKRPNEHAKIVDAEGKRVEGIGEKLEVCVVFFDKLYNYVHAIKLLAKIEPEEPWCMFAPLYSSAWAQGLPQPGLGGDLGIDVVEPTFGEVVIGTKQQQSSRGKQSNGRVAQVWSGGGSDVHPQVYFQDVALKESARRLEANPNCNPSQNDNWANLGNYKGINLLDIIGKVYIWVFMGLLQVVMDTCLNEGQMGFRLGRSCSDALFAINQLTN